MTAAGRCMPVWSTGTPQGRSRNSSVRGAGAGNVERMDGETPARVLLVDDHAGMATAVRVMLRADGRFELAGVAGTLSEALAAGDDHDAVILDLNLPDAAGAEVVRRFARAHP